MLPAAFLGHQALSVYTLRSLSCNWGKQQTGRHEMASAAIKSRRGSCALLSPSINSPKR